MDPDFDTILERMREAAEAEPRADEPTDRDEPEFSAEQMDEDAYRTTKGGSMPPG